MDAKLKSFLEELENFGAAHDQATPNREERMRNVAPKTGEFLSFLISWKRPDRILEIGTSNGYSTIWLASAAQGIGSKVDTIELNEVRAGMAQENFEKSELAEWINLFQQDAGTFLQTAHTHSYPIIFLDSERTEYCSWWEDLKRVLTPGGLLIVDNLLSHAGEFVDFLTLVKQSQDIKLLEMPLDQGLLLLAKNP